MHFKLDLKEKKTLMKKRKSVANRTFFQKSYLYLALLVVFGEWDTSVCSIYG